MTMRSPDRMQSHRLWDSVKAALPALAVQPCSRGWRAFGRGVTPGLMLGFHGLVPGRGLDGVAGFVGTVVGFGGAVGAGAPYGDPFSKASTMVSARFIRHNYGIRVNNGLSTKKSGGVSSAAHPLMPPSHPPGLGGAKGPPP